MAGTDRANHGGIGRLALPIATLGLALAGLVGLAAVSSGDSVNAPVFSSRYMGGMSTRWCAPAAAVSVAT